MGKKVKERVISQNEYLARLEQGVPVGDCWVDMGNGQLAYALQEVVVVARQFNKYKDKFLMPQTVSVLAAVDNTRVDTRQRDARIHAVEQQMAFEQKKKEIKERLYKITQKYFNDAKARSFPNHELLEKIQISETLLLLAIEKDESPLSVYAFPSDLYAKETQLIKEFVQIRSITAKEFKPSDPGTIRRAPTEYEKWMMERRQLDPFAYQMGSRLEIQIVAVALLGGGTFSYLRAAGVFTLETNMTAAAIKGGTSAIGQAIAGGGAKDINVIGVASDAFLLPGLGAIGGNMVEVKPFNTKQLFRLVGYNKSFGEFGIQAVTSYGTGKLGDYGFSKFSPYLETSGEQIFYNINYNTWIQVISNKISNTLASEYEE
ncbi:MAG: hypothetical protein LBG80_12320 [Bacteroidales bacterium]|jgi:hypothetical protein|nr:hypothetical protein [Bacteroidales bacterium]